MPQAQDFDLDTGLGLQVEHICLESEQPGVTMRTLTARSGPTYRFVSRWRGCETELAFAPDLRLAVRSRRRGSPVHRYAVDLRFIDTDSVAARRIAWRWWLATLVLVLASALEHWLVAQFVGPRWHALGIQGFIVLSTAAVCVGLLGLYRTRVTLELRSLHGAARLAEVTGTVGSAQEMRQFVAELARRVGDARRHAGQSRQHFLRDEMREHHRLWNEGVLSAASYEASKRRILAAHT